MEQLKKFFNYGSFIIIFSILVVMVAWRLVLIFPQYKSGINVQVWAASYQIMAWVGAVIGLIFAKKWGGFKSLLGRTALAFSFGLLAQSFGQCVFSWYFYSGNTLPYPSLADLGFVASIPFYIYGISSLAQVAGSKFSLKSSVNKVWGIFIPALILAASYFVFLKNYQFDPTQPVLKAILDFGYPLGQAIYISIALVAYVFSKDILGGVMRQVVLFFIWALIAQYAADYTFLYQSMHGTFVGGGIDDCLYLTSYFLMSLSLVQLGVVFHQIDTNNA